MPVKIVGKEVEVVVSEQALELNGRRIGFFKDYSIRPNGYQYHVGVYVAGDKLHSSDGLIQGLGDSFEEAMAEAFASGRKKANAVLNGIEEMEAEIAASEAEEVANG